MKKYLLILLAAITLVACSSTPSMKDMTVRMGDTDSIQITDMRSLMRNGVLTAQVPFRTIASQTSSPIALNGLVRMV